MNYKDRYKIKLDDLGYLRLDPVPTQEEVEKYYLEEFYSGNYQQLNDSQLAVQQEEQDFFNNRWENIYQKITSHFNRKDNISVFDIGFGFAQALLYLKDKGFVASGLEPSKEGYEYAKSKGLSVFNSGIENFEHINQKFDVVMMLNVLEHLRKPYKTLIDIKNQLLKKGGLLIVDVPNEFNDFQVIANQEYDLKEWWIVPPNHINYFTAVSLKNIIVKAGYDVVSLEASFPLEMFMLMGDVYVGNGDVGKKCHQRRVMFENLMNKYGKQEQLTKFYESLADLNLGRQTIAFATSK